MRKALIAVVALSVLGGCSKPAGRPAQDASRAPSVGARPSSAALLPRRKVGLWRMAVNTSSGPGFSVTGKVCVDAARAGDFDIKPPAMKEKAHCDRTKFRPVPGGWAFETKCVMKGHTTTTQGVVTGDFSSSYHVETTSRTDPPIQGGLDVAKASADARWLGPCPEGMKPGEIRFGGLNLGG